MISNHLKIVIVICSLLVPLSLYSKPYVPKIQRNSVVTISDEWNLNGQSVSLPEGITLNFIKNGKISNGSIVGLETKIKGKKERILHKVTISGSWNIPEISSGMFKSLSGINDLRNLIALTNPKVHNNVTIEQGTYLIELSKDDRIGIVINSNTDVTLKGSIALKSNDLRSYSVVMATGNNISITGPGSIIGDRKSHIDKGGEWGMGLNIDAAENVLIQNLTITDCWGDCIYIGNKSGNVTIDNCSLYRGRRQGISVTSADNVHVTNTTIKDIKGTSPEFAIDIEPNKNEAVNTVYLEGLRIIDCGGGITSNGKADGAKIGSILVKDCIVQGKVKYYAYRFRHLDNLNMSNCKGSIDGDPTVLIQYAKNIEYKDVIINGNHNPFKIQKSGKVVKGNKQK